MALMRQHRWIWKAVFCKAGTLEPMFAMQTTIWLSVYHTTVCASRESINASTDSETARSPRNSELRELSKSDQFWWKIFSSNWIQLSQAQLVASEYTIFVGLRFTGHKGTPLMVARLSFQKFNSFMHLGVRETRKFQFVTVNNSKGISGHDPSYVHDAVPKRKIFLPHTLASFRTWKRESFDPKRNNKSSFRDW